MPGPDAPVRFYSNQSRHDIKLTFIEALKSADKSIFLSVYGISDPQILSTLTKKSDAKVPVLIEYDKKASANLYKCLPAAVEYKTKPCKGLMHRKIVVIDKRLVFLGTANLTTTSLRHHANFVMGLDCAPLASYLIEPDSSRFRFEVKEQQGEIYLLPDPQGEALQHLLETIDSTKNSIHLAMFTLTHPKIAEALIRAQQRGVDVRVAIDYFTAKGASRKTVAALRESGIKIFLSQGRELLHHKWALLDNETLILGSANWTKAAFSKNADFLLFLSSLAQTQKKFLAKLWRVIEDESTL